MTRRTDAEQRMSPGSASAPGSGTDYERLVRAADTHAIFMLDSEGRIESWTDGASDIYGYDETDVQGGHISLLTADDSADRPGFDLDATLSRAREESVEFEQWHERADGDVFWATMTLSPIYNDVFHGYAVVSRDTTTQKQYTRMLERQNDRLKEFTDILSHDLRNPLGVLDGRLELYKETGEDDHIEVVEETIDRMERLIDDLLRIANQGDVIEDPEPVDLEAVVHTASEGTLPNSATVEYDPVPKIMSEPDRLVEMFENLFRNAAEHGGKSVTVRVGPLEDGFYVADDGPGIPDEIKPKVFDHGFTTEYQGTGFGLSLVRTIVGAHGWDVTAIDSEDGGARFEVTNIDFVN